MLTIILLILIFMVLASISILFFSLFLIESKRVKRNELQIESLSKLVNRLREKEKDINKRESFRLDTFNIDCAFEFIQFGEYALDNLKGKRGNGNIINISISGLKFGCTFDIPIRKLVVLMIQFKLHEELYELKATVIRKEAKAADVFYGVKFVETSTKELMRLSNSIRKLQRERKITVISS